MPDKRENRMTADCTCRPDICGEGNGGCVYCNTVDGETAMLEQRRGAGRQDDLDDVGWREEYRLMNPGAH
jgi:hypothetical protein